MSDIEDGPQGWFNEETGNWDKEQPDMPAFAKGKFVMDPKASGPERMQGIYEFATFHLEGVPWYDAPIPRRLHRCKVQTRGELKYGFEIVERCACGSIRLDGRGFWTDRNTRGKS